MVGIFADLITLNSNIITKVADQGYNEYDGCSRCMVYFSNNDDASDFIRQYRTHYKNPVGILGIKGKVRISFNY